MTIYWGSAASFIFFMVVGWISARYFNFQGQTWYMFMGIMGSLGISSSAFFYYFQNKLQNRKQARAEAAAAGAVAPSGAKQAGAETQQWVKEANARLAQSKPGVGIENLPMIFIVGDRGTAKTSGLLN